MSAVLTICRGFTAINDETTAEPRRSWRWHCGLCRTSTAVAPRLRCDGGITDKSLHEIYIPTEAVSCKNVHCSDENHIDAINKLYSDIVNSLIQPGEQIMQNNKNKYTHKPGWAAGA